MSCAHGRERSLCNDCGGSSLCGHGRRRSRCKECGESSVEESDGDYDVTPDDVNFDICAMGKTRNKSNKSSGHKGCGFSEAEGQSINGTSEQQLPPRPELIDDFVVNDDL